MKTRFITLLAAFAALIGSVSCTNNSGKDEIIYYSFATVNKNGANDNSKLTYITDDARLLIPDSPAPAAFKAREGQRVVLYFSIQKEEDELTQTTQIKLYQIDTNVVIGNTAIVSGSEALADLGVEGVSVNTSPYTPQTTPKYLNIYVGFNANKHEKHDFTLALNTQDTGDEKELKLTLAHKSNGDVSSLDYWQWVSFPVEPFLDRLEGKSRAAINVKTRMNGNQVFYLATPNSGSKCIQVK